ncbi:MAG: 2-iminoacetate synthase ThiH [Proteobacteria bacterium]|nr:2-iminoacetate synthase ThiH [Pseudomonadota bacterium]
MNFLPIYQSYNWKQIQTEIYSKTSADVERALSATGTRTLENFKALISPAGDEYLEQMARESQRLTQKRFGKTIQLYIPLYLSNECCNSCSYCGFNAGNTIERVTLSLSEIMLEVEAIKTMGFDHVLLVTGEAGSKNVDYLLKIFQMIKPYFCNISIEVQPMEQEDYERLIDAGLHGVYIYQETYGPRYAEYHPKGQKRDFKYRLSTPDRLGMAGIHKMGLGCLIGLDDWRTDSWFTAAHLSYLEKTYWRSKFSISFPRIRPAAGGFQPVIEMNDRELVQLLCAYRLFNENVELSISTRERQDFRDHIIKLGATALSAGSKTNPGGYAVQPQGLDQFQVEDNRTPAEIAGIISAQGYEPVWKDWF